MEEGLTDPVRVFIKNEPHTKKKIAEGRFRLISSVSVLDQLVEKFFSVLQNETEIFEVTEHPSLPGLGICQRHLEVLQTRLPPAFVSTDVSGWDFSVQDWELEAEAEDRIRLCSAAGRLAQLIRNRYYCIINKVFVLSDGTVYVPPPGIQASGCYNTSSTNSRIRFRLALLTGATEAFTMGDDCLEVRSDSEPVAVEKYAVYGRILTDWQPSTPELYEFCSHRISNEGEVRHAPLQTPRSVYRYLEGQRTEQTLEQLRSFIRFLSDEEKERIEEVIMRFGMPHKNGEK